MPKVFPCSGPLFFQSPHHGPCPASSFKVSAETGFLCECDAFVDVKELGPSSLWNDAIPFAIPIVVALQYEVRGKLWIFEACSCGGKKCLYSWTAGYLSYLSCTTHIKMWLKHLFGRRSDFVGFLSQLKSARFESECPQDFCIALIYVATITCKEKKVSRAHYSRVCVGGYLILDNLIRAMKSKQTSAKSPALKRSRTKTCASELF